MRSLLLLLLLLAPLRVEAQFPPITDRDYALDLYQGSVLGSTRVVGMGGASAALAEGATAFSINPAAAAVRAATSRGRWDWDLNLDWLSPTLGSDHDNNGVATTSAEVLVLTGGVVVQYRDWGFGASVDSQAHTVEVADGTRAELGASVGQVVVARSFLRRALSVGLGLRFGELTLDEIAADGASRPLFVLQGTTFVAGVVVRPGDRDLRLGATVGLPARGSEVTAASCDPTDCAGYVLPERVELPWQATLGVAWRRVLGGQPSRWNQPSPGDFRDERALLLAADVVVSGAVDDGHGLEAFVAKQLQPSGTTMSLSLRAGAELEWLPGRLRVRGGSYYEPGRFPGVPGRVHATAGAELRVCSFRLWGHPYRLRLALTGDVAARYGNVGVSLGFWH